MDVYDLDFKEISNFYLTILVSIKIYIHNISTHSYSYRFVLSSNTYKAMFVYVYISFT